MDYKLRFYRRGSSRYGRGTKFQWIENVFVKANANRFQDVNPVSKETVKAFFLVTPDIMWSNWRLTLNKSQSVLINQSSPPSQPLVQESPEATT